MKIFPRIVPPTVSRTLWLVVIVVALIFWHREILRWTSDGPLHALVEHLAELKLVAAGVFVLGAGGRRALRHLAAARNANRAHVND